MSYKIVIIDADGYNRSCECDKYFDAAIIYNSLCKSFQNVTMLQHTLTRTNNEEKLYKTICAHQNH